MAIRERVRYVKQQLHYILLYYADDDMFRPLWAIFRSQNTMGMMHLKIINARPMTFPMRHIKEGWSL